MTESLVEPGTKAGTKKHIGPIVKTACGCASERIVRGTGRAALAGAETKASTGAYEADQDP